MLPFSWVFSMSVPILLKPTSPVSQSDSKFRDALAEEGVSVWALIGLRKTGLSLAGVCVVVLVRMDMSAVAWNFVGFVGVERLLFLLMITRGFTFVPGGDVETRPIALALLALLETTCNLGDFNNS